MEFDQIRQHEIRQRTNIDHYNKVQQRLVRTYCCGCISSRLNSVLICFFWAAISFYFTILAFMQKSPFYSYVEDVPLVAFGSINLLFGIVTLSSMFIFLMRWFVMREQEKRGRWEGWVIPANTRFFTAAEESSTTVYAITASALAVLIVTLVNFILFIINKNAFDTWCLNSSAGYIVDVYKNGNQTLTNATITTMESALKNANGIYNCNRLYEDEIKWSLLCMLIMFVVYIHWILILAARRTYTMFNPIALPGPVPGINEIRNIRPSKHKGLEIFKNAKPSKNLWRELLVHKQYGAFKDGNEERQIDLDKHLHEKNHSTMIGSNVIQFENDLYASKEITQPNQAVVSFRDAMTPYSTNSSYTTATHSS